MTKVIQSTPVWLPQTQTWMYNQAKYLSDDIESHIVCEKTENLDQFHLPDIHVIPPKSLLARYGNSGMKGSRLVRLFWLWLNCLKIRPDVVHSHFGTIGWYDSLVIRITKVKHIVTFYGDDVNMLPTQYPSWRNRYNSLFESADLFLCEGPHMAECIKKLGCQQEKIRVHHLGVEVDKIPFKPRRWHPGETLRILISATFREKKGIPYALDALGRLKNEADFEITIIGDSTTTEKSRKEKECILKVIEKHKMKSIVKMFGFQPYSVLMEIAYKNHVFLSPSITAEDGDTEGGAPVTIIEMAATGMPVVSTRHCDIPEVIKNGCTGLLAEERDSEGLTYHLKWLIADPALWPKMIGAGRELIEKEFNVQRLAAKLGEFYKGLNPAYEF